MMFIKKNWNEITIADYEKIKEIGESDFTELDKEIQILSLLTGEDEDKILNLSIEEYAHLKSELQFLSEFNFEKDKTPTQVIIQGKKFNVNYNLKNYSIAQYVDFEQFNKAKNTAGVLSTILIPEGEKYGVSDNVELIQNNLPFPVAQSIYFFWYRKSLDSIHNLLQSCFQTRLPMMTRIRLRLKKWMKCIFG